MLAENGGLTAADVGAVLRGGNGGQGFGWGDNGAWWILILFLFALGGRGFGGGGADVQRGFDQQATQSSIASLQSQVGTGFADAALARCQGDANIVQSINGAKDTINGTLNSLSMALQQCCYENRAATADLKYTVASEACTTRQEIANGVRDIITNQAQNTQSILGKLCQLELDGYKQKISDQATEIASLRTAISQTAQTAQLIQNNDAQTAALLQRLNPNPIPAYVVQNPNCCGAVNFGCGA